jgi:hypothetical protein
MNIVLELHREANMLLLDSADIYNFVGEESNAELELALYVAKWCEYLNYPFLHNRDMRFTDADCAKLEGWIDGYSFAKKIDVDERNDAVRFKFGKHNITLHQPFEF